MGRNRSIMASPPVRARVGVVFGDGFVVGAAVRVLVGDGGGVLVLRGVGVWVGVALGVLGAAVLVGNGVMVGVGVVVAGGGTNCQSSLMRPRPVRLT